MLVKYVELLNRYCSQFIEIRRKKSFERCWNRVLLAPLSPLASHDRASKEQERHLDFDTAAIQPKPLFCDSGTALAASCDPGFQHWQIFTIFNFLRVSSSGTSVLGLLDSTPRPLEPL